MRKRYQRQPWWTRTRALDALKRFYAERKEAPTSSEAWQAATAGTAVSHRGVDNPFPSYSVILKYFSSFRAAWTEVGVKVNRDWEPWEPEEDWFISEGAGVITRKEMAAALDRTPNAVHRRLYDLGINSRTARGWTFSRVMTATSLPDYVLRKYANLGELPYFRGAAYLFVDPADLLVITEYDWEGAPAELVEAIRRSLMWRLACVVARRDWRAGRIYQPRKVNSTSRRQNRRALPAGPKPFDLNTGDWVKAKDDPQCEGVEGRVGYTHAVYWSPYGRLSAVRRKWCGDKGEWVARVEFKGSVKSGLPRRNRILPLSALDKAEQQPERVAPSSCK